MFILGPVLLLGQCSARKNLRAMMRPGPVEHDARRPRLGADDILPVMHVAHAAEGTAESSFALRSPVLTI